MKLKPLYALATTSAIGSIAGNMAFKRVSNNNLQSPENDITADNNLLFLAHNAGSKLYDFKKQFKKESSEVNSGSDVIEYVNNRCSVKSAFSTY